jgi:hypothetical protein
MTLMQADREGTREFIEQLPEGLPVTEMGSLGSLDDALKASDYPEQWLTPQERRRVKAAAARTRTAISATSSLARSSGRPDHGHQRLHPGLRVRRPHHRAGVAPSRVSVREGLRYQDLNLIPSVPPRSRSARRTRRKAVSISSPSASLVTRSRRVNVGRGSR